MLYLLHKIGYLDSLSTDLGILVHNRNQHIRKPMNIVDQIIGLVEKWFVSITGKKMK